MKGTQIDFKWIYKGKDYHKMIERKDLYVVFEGLVKGFQDDNDNEISLKMSHIMMKECLTYRRSWGVPNHLYNILWIHQKEMSQKYIKMMLQRCISISILLKRDSKTAFFQKKLMDYHSISSSSNPS